MSQSSPASPDQVLADWKRAVAPYRRPHLGRSLWQLANTVLPYIGLWVAMVFALQVSYWLTLVLAIPAAGFLMRSFIISHDCGHGAFFRSRKANTIVGIRGKSASAACRSHHNLRAVVGVSGHIFRPRELESANFSSP
jgi:fatty acid desaturase